MAEPPNPPASGDLGAAIAALRPAVRALVGHLLGVLPGHPDIDDCENEVYRRTFEGRARVDPAAPLKPWVLGIARHVALDAQRARRRAARRAAPGAAVVEDDDSPMEKLVDAAPGPEERALLAERTRRIGRALERLPAEQRRALLLHGEGLAYGQIAKQIGAPLGTVCTWIARARQGLKEALQDQAQDRRP
jgi:RNA polymerase sigma-70 factor (ECF subfamily)